MVFTARSPTQRQLGRFAAIDSRRLEYTGTSNKAITFERENPYGTEEVQQAIGGGQKDRID